MTKKAHTIGETEHVLPSVKMGATREVVGRLVRAANSKRTTMTLSVDEVVWFGLKTFAGGPGVVSMLVPKNTTARTKYLRDYTVAMAAWSGGRMYVDVRAGFSRVVTPRDVWPSLPRKQGEITSEDVERWVARYGWEFRPEFVERGDA